MSTVVTLRLSSDVIQAIDEAARLEHRTRSGWIQARIAEVLGEDRTVEEIASPARQGRAKPPEATTTPASRPAPRLQPATAPTADDWSGAYDRMRAKHK